MIFNNYKKQIRVQPTTAKERKEEWKRKNLYPKTKFYTCVEDGIQYDYGSITATILSVWAKDKKNHGIKPLFKEFYDQLPSEQQSEIRVSKYNHAEYQRMVSQNSR